MEELDFEEKTENKTKKTRKGTTQEIEDIFSGKIVPKFHCFNSNSKEKREELREMKKNFSNNSKKWDVRGEDIEAIENFRINK